MNSISGCFLFIGFAGDIKILISSLIFHISCVCVPNAWVLFKCHFEVRDERKKRKNVNIYLKWSILWKWRRQSPKRNLNETFYPKKKVICFMCGFLSILIWFFSFRLCAWKTFLSRFRFVGIGIRDCFFSFYVTFLTISINLNLKIGKKKAKRA